MARFSDQNILVLSVLQLTSAIAPGPVDVKQPNNIKDKPLCFIAGMMSFSALAFSATNLGGKRVLLHPHFLAPDRKE